MRRKPATDTRHTDPLVLDEAWTGLDTAARAESERVVTELTASDASVRICAGNEPPAARAAVAAAVGPGRAHLACLLAALAALAALAVAAALGTAATVVVTLISDPASADHQVRVEPLPAGAAGLLAVPACALLGTAVGALTTWPLLSSPGRAVPAMTLGALVVTGSPAQSAITSLVTGSRSATVPVPLLPPAAAALLTVAATAGARALTARRSP